LETPSAHYACDCIRSSRDVVGMHARLAKTVEIRPRIFHRSITMSFYSTFVKRYPTWNLMTVKLRAKQAEGGLAPLLPLSLLRSTLTYPNHPSAPTRNIDESHRWHDHDVPKLITDRTVLGIILFYFCVILLSVGANPKLDLSYMHNIESLVPFALFPASDMSSSLIDGPSPPMIRLPHSHLWTLLSVRWVSPCRVCFSAFWFGLSVKCPAAPRSGHAREGDRSYVRGWRRVMEVLLYACRARVSDVVRVGVGCIFLCFGVPTCKFLCLLSLIFS
jgi:hypothetical protein